MRRGEGSARRAPFHLVAQGVPRSRLRNWLYLALRLPVGGSGSERLFVFQDRCDKRIPFPLLKYFPVFAEILFRVY